MQKVRQGGRRFGRFQKMQKSLYLKGLVSQVYNPRFNGLEGPAPSTQDRTRIRTGSGSDRVAFCSSLRSSLQ